MLPDRVSNPGPLTYESGALPIVLRGPTVIYVFLTFTSSRLTTLSVLNNWVLNYNNQSVYYIISLLHNIRSIIIHTQT